MANKIVLFSTGRIWLLTQLMNGSNTTLNGNVTFRFFANDVTLSPAGPSAPFIPLVMPGYAPFTLVGAVDGGIDVNGNDTWNWPTTIITNTSPSGGPYISYGYWVTADVDGTTLWGQLFDVPPVWMSEGYEVSVTPHFSLGELVLP